MAPRGMTPVRMIDMKKTLITLAALSMVSVAAAADKGVGIADATYLNPGSDTTTTLTSTQFSNAEADFTMQIVLDWNAAVSDLGVWDHQSYVKVGTNTDMWYSLSLGLFHGDTDEKKDNIYVQMYQENARDNIQGSTLGGDSTSAAFSRAEYMNENGQLVLFASYDHSEKTFTLFGVKKDGLTVTSGYIDAAQVSDWPNGGTGTYMKMQAIPDVDVNLTNVIDSISTFNEAMTSANVSYYMQTSIPEPATATLSLLALVGLAARRRRK